ncbi:MAG: GntR family transcriptional regulator [Chloroflexota bacterium]
MRLPTSMLAASSRRRVETESLSGAAYRRIKDMIISLELPPASPIDEAKLVEELELGLTPVRQAIRRLSHENLVVIYPRRGTIVADLNLADLQKIFEIRLELESLSARLAAERATQTQIADLHTLVDKSITLLEEGGTQQYNRQLIEVDHEMHMLIGEASQNEFLLESLEWLYNHVQRLWNLSIDQVSGLAESVQEHKMMLEAIRNQDGDQAATIMRDHVARFQERFIQLT